VIISRNHVTQNILSSLLFANNPDNHTFVGWNIDGKQSAIQGILTGIVRRNDNGQFFDLAVTYDNVTIMLAAQVNF
jgi:hypothetical protein